jgi:hypothetical protein
MRNNNEERSKTVFLPNRSLNVPAKETPAMQPTSAELTYQPSSIVLRANWLLTNEIVPEITAVSNPNRKPPIAAVEAAPTRSDEERVLEFGVGSPKFEVLIFRSEIEGWTSDHATATVGREKYGGI